jgi:hypothetical protein
VSVGPEVSVADGVQPADEEMNEAPAVQEAHAPLPKL